MLVRLDLLFIAPEDGAVSEVDAVSPLNPVRTDDDDPLLNLTLDRDRGS